MQQTVIEQKKKIDAACTICFRQLVSYCEKLKAYNQEVQKISQSPYVDDEKSRQISELEGRTKVLVVPMVAEIERQIQLIREYSEVIAVTPMDSTDLVAVGTLTNLIGAGSTTDTGLGIFENLLDYVNMYRGQPKALKVIQAAMERAGELDPNALKSKHGGSLVFDVANRIRQVENTAGQLHGLNINCAFDMSRELEIYAYDMGVELTDSFKKMVNAVNPDDYNDLYFTRLANLMGVDPTV